MDRIIQSFESERLPGPPASISKRCPDPDRICGANLDGPWTGVTTVIECPVCGAPLVEMQIT